MNDPNSGRSRGPRTRAVHGPNDSSVGAVSTPIVRSATFGFPSLDAMLAERDRGAAGAFYQRIGHPTLRGCEERLAALEQAEGALLFASGMSAISSVLLAHVRAGDHVVAARQCYGGTLDVLRWGAERLGWSTTLVDAREPSGWERAFRAESRVFLVESPTNPTLVVLDIAHAARVAQRHAALLVVDNTVASPVGQRPLALGAGLVVYSATKSIGGHSDLLAGAVIGGGPKLDAVWTARTVFGGVPDPETAWLIERSMKTLPLRVERANANALAIATRLAAHPRVARVFYPGLETHPGHDVAKRQMTLGFGPLLSFEMKDGAAAAERTAGAFRLVRHAPSLGGVETLASLPAHTSHRHMDEEERSIAGIPAGLMRISVGIEDFDDLWADFARALDPA
jgi:cystathionine beta-lyase/cystathionine gamma-synthase